MTDVELQTYTGQSIKVIGTVHVDVNYLRQRKKMPLDDFPKIGSGPNLL